MDVSRYNFMCQKGLHQGLQYAKSFGHQNLEVEHVALALLRSEALDLGYSAERSIEEQLKGQLSQMQKVFGNVKIKFGQRLDRALDEAEEKVPLPQEVDETTLWACLIRQSTLLRTLLSGLEIENKAGETEPASDVNIEKNSEVAKNEFEEKLSDRSSSVKGAKDLVASFSLPDKLAKVLQEFTVDLSSLAERGELDPVVGRDLESRRVLEVLGRKKKNNPLLIGEAGVGKTAIAEALALRIAEGRVPEPMKRRRILSLDLGALVAGSKFRGEFESRVKDLLAAVKYCGGGVILFIDEIHMLVGAGSADGSSDAANMMKPALARGELRCLGATTLDEYRTYIEKDPALERRFQEVLIEEPSELTTLSILRGLKGRYEIHHGVQIDDSALVSAVELSSRFITSRRFPDKAIDLIDEACSRLRLQIDSLPVVIDELRSAIDQQEIERTTLSVDQGAVAALVKLDVSLNRNRSEYQKLQNIWRHHQGLLETMRKFEARKQELENLFESTKTQGEFDFAAKLQNEEIPSLNNKLNHVRAELSLLQDKDSWLRQEVGDIEIAEVLASWTGVPVENILKKGTDSIKEIEERLKERVFGQDVALSAVGRAIKRSSVGVNDPNRPIGVFLFLGPTGVGKTETAKALAVEMFADEKRMVRIDMSEFMEQHSVSRLIGSPPGYVGHGDGGELTEPVRRNPYTVVLLDEIEKANPKILDLLLQIFDDGRLTDSRGRLVNFKNTILIMTSNIALNLQLKVGDDGFEEEKRLALADYLRPELVGRIDELVVFCPLGRKHYLRLLNKQIALLNSRLADRQFRVILGPEISRHLIDGVTQGKFGARALHRSFQALVMDRVSERILTKPEACYGAWKLDHDSQGNVSWSLDDSLHRYLPAAASG